MSTRLIKSYAKRTGRTVEEISQKWEKAKAVVKEEFHLNENDAEFYPRLVTTLKKMIGVEEEFHFLDKFKKLLREE